MFAHDTHPGEDIEHDGNNDVIFIIIRIGAGPPTFNIPHFSHGYLAFFPLGF